jgi:hypothetical protein
LGGGSPPQTAEIVASHPFHHRSQINESCIRYLAGRDVRRYKIDWSGDWVSYGEWVAEFPPRQIFEEGRILVREIIGKIPYAIKACYTEESFLYNRSVIQILAKDKANRDLMLSLLLILNSSKASNIFFILSKKTRKKLFPKLLISDLKEFPIPYSIFSHQKEAASLATRCLTAKNEAELDALNQEADLFVEHLYLSGSAELELGNYFEA